MALFLMVVLILAQVNTRCYHHHHHHPYIRWWWTWMAWTTSIMHHQWWWAWTCIRLGKPCSNNLRWCITGPHLFLLTLATMIITIIALPITPMACPITLGVVITLQLICSVMTTLAAAVQWCKLAGSGCIIFGQQTCSQWEVKASHNWRGVHFCPHCCKRVDLVRIVHPASSIM